VTDFGLQAATRPTPIEVWRRQTVSIRQSRSGSLDQAALAVAGFGIGLSCLFDQEM
jgi:hypothetical protein